MPRSDIPISHTFTYHIYCIVAVADELTALCPRRPLECEGGWNCKCQSLLLYEKRQLASSFQLHPSCWLKMPKNAQNVFLDLRKQPARAKQAEYTVPTVSTLPTVSTVWPFGLTFFLPNEHECIMTSPLR